MHLHGGTYARRMLSPGSHPSDQAITAWARLVRVSQGLLESVEADLKAAGMPQLVWYDVLLELRRAQPDGLRPFQLQERMLLAQYNLSRLLDRIVKSEYAVRVPCDDDGRGHVLQITGSGLELLQRMWPVYHEAIARHFAGKLETVEAIELARLLTKLQAPAGSLPAEADRRVHLASNTSRRVRFRVMKSQS